MDIDDFWTLIELAKQHDGSRSERLEFLRRQLAALPGPQIVQFQLCLDWARGRAYTSDLWAAARQIFGGSCSDDGFEYFRNWLISLGRDVFEPAVDDPDTLAGVPEIRRLAGRDSREWSEEEWPEWEVLDYVAGEAYARFLGIDDDSGDALDDAIEASEQEDEPLVTFPEDDDEQSEASSAVELPMLTALFR